MPDYNALPKVVRVLDNYTVILNIGLIAGVSEGDEYLIFRLGEIISDPDTGEDLGLLEVVLGRVSVAHVQDRICTAISSELVYHPSAKRIIRRERNALSALAAFAPSGTEEIEERKPPTRKAIEAVVGDLARPL